MNADGKDSERITNLETAIMHLQNDFEALNEVVLSNSRRLDDLQALLQRLTDKFEAQQGETEERNPEDEKPPHY